ncbi:hypothetical protein [Bradyrhizobium sp. F1.13.3]|uniref:hypothetical protein n=1 Tax=Bradyrhizobium sp. F1.13.3 TaxID=3156351 RepID=UPI0033961697
MSAFFTFNLDRISYQIAEARSSWTIRCSARFVEPQYPISSTARDTDSAEISIYRREENKLNATMLVRDLDEQIAQWRDQGYACDADVSVLSHYAATERWGEFIGLSVALSPKKFDAVQAFLLQHIGRPDLTASVTCPFHGFSEPENETPAFPTFQSFYQEGRPFFITGDHSVAFGCPPPA